jgi:hypothetical protein
MKHFSREDDLDGVRRAVLLSAPAIPALVLIAYLRDLLGIEPIDNISGAKLIAESAAFDAQVFINQYGHGFFPRSDF